ncbi:hypothetical protein K3495_g5931 [Podosphaera aphanis]|nr:hypothetical protein K3495_g5931 [Podosphaera aphanis]
MTGTVHGQPLSPTSTSGGFTNSISSMNEVPPLEETEVHYNLTTHDGQTIRPEIFARIDKGFFMADNNWTCYRRNYFSLNCSFSLSPPVTSGNIYLQLPGSPPVRVHAFCMSISAVVDGRDGKPIELVQHTPKRDKGPQDRPARVVLVPRTSASHGTYDGITGRPGVYDGQSFNPSSNRPATEATFERIQFKNATANNGKRRAAQQYYHLLVELYADVANESSERYIKIASRISAPMVVRGRSPGHYQSDQRGSSNTSSGPGGSGGGSGGTYPASTGLGRNLGDISMRGGTSSILPGSSYTVGYDGRAHRYRSALPSSNISIDPTVSHNNSKHIDTSSCFMYCAGTAWGEGGEPRCQPAISDYSVSKNKSGYGYELPSLTLGIQDNSGLNNRNCGPWNASIENKGCFPSSFTQHEMSIT